ncbi:MAG: ShlB/FhaC/HecB family hemolysin secretion/activation protein [Verrucomicrobiota bacterium]|nr:ShlB/FhaC/HecB family hemolysin secretion/activation protein [Verrucomicrobiota bacterium]
MSSRNSILTVVGLLYLGILSPDLNGQQTTWQMDADGVYREFTVDGPGKKPRRKYQESKQKTSSSTTISRSSGPEQMLYIMDADGVYRQYPASVAEAKSQKVQQGFARELEKQRLAYTRKTSKYFPEGNLPSPPPETQTGATAQNVSPEADKVLVKELKGLIFVKGVDQVKKTGVDDFRGIDVDGLTLLKDKGFVDVTKAYIGKPITSRTLNTMTRDVVAYYTKKELPVVHVFVPAQKITSGIVQVVVIEGRIGKIETKGNKYFSDSILTDYVRSKPGQVINSRTMQEDVDALNANPFRRVDVVYSPGAAAGTTDIVLQTKDRFPVRPFVGYENSGNDLTGTDRFIAGFNWGNAFFLDHQLNYQFTSDFDFDKLRAHSASYTVPLPWRHRWTAFGSYAETKADLPDPFRLQGEAWQLGTRYAITLPSLRTYQHEIKGGFDFKRSNNDLEFAGVNVFGAPTDIAQFVIDYNGTLKDRFGVTTFSPNLVVSPGDLTDDNTDADFGRARAGAVADYVYGQVNLERVTKLPGEFSLLNRFKYQFASDNLLGSEQLGVGGADSVRGYPSRALNGDEGYLLSAELRTPSLSIGEALGHSEWQDDLQFLVFVDYGVADVKNPLPGESDRDALGIGPGFRYRLSTYVTLRLDYGFQLIEHDGIDPDGRLHLGAIVSF